jgi:hypothetical protein
MKTLQELLEEIRRRIAKAIEDGDQATAEQIFELEYKAAEEAAENIWECR